MPDCGINELQRLNSRRGSRGCADCLVVEINSLDARLSRCITQGASFGKKSTRTPNRVFVVTDKWLREHSRAGSWTADQFSMLNIPWPPQRGWKWKVIGREITDDQRARFERALRSKAARSDSTLDMFRG
jgi:hypothetical protein